jgi:glucan phosphoethanolaminetransferase (alkaline phosphatase superfamily)
MWPNILILLVAAAGIILLQIYLSKRDGKWFGLILPAISFIVSWLVVISIVAYTNIGIVSHSVSEEGTIVTHKLEDNRQEFGSVVSQVIVTFLLYNISTVVLIAIYAACREKGKRRIEIEKMQIQDLE